MHTVEAAPALGGQSQVPSTPGSVLASCDRVEKYEIDRAHVITIKAIAVFSFQERNMITPYYERGSAAFDGRQQAAHACADYDCVLAEICHGVGPLVARSRCGIYGSGRSGVERKQVHGRSGF